MALSTLHMCTLHSYSTIQDVWFPRHTSRAELVDSFSWWPQNGPTWICSQLSGCCSTRTFNDGSLFKFCCSLTFRAPECDSYPTTWVSVLWWNETSTQCCWCCGPCTNIPTWWVCWGPKRNSPLPSTKGSFSTAVPPTSPFISPSSPSSWTPYPPCDPSWNEHLFSGPPRNIFSTSGSK